MPLVLYLKSDCKRKQPAVPQTLKASWVLGFMLFTSYHLCVTGKIRDWPSQGFSSLQLSSFGAHVPIFLLVADRCETWSDLLQLLPIHFNTQHMLGNGWFEPPLSKNLMFYPQNCCFVLSFLFFCILLKSLVLHLVKNLDYICIFNIFWCSHMVSHFHFWLFIRICLQMYVCICVCLHFFYCMNVNNIRRVQMQKPLNAIWNFLL